MWNHGTNSNYMKNQEILKLWKSRLTEFGRLNNAIPGFVKRPSLGDSTDYYHSSMLIPFGSSKIEFTQGAHVHSYGISYSIISFFYSFENTQSLEIALGRPDFFDFLFPQKIAKTDSAEFDKIFTIRTNDAGIALKIFSDPTIQDVFLKSEYLVFNLQTSKSRISTVLFKHRVEELHSLADLMELLENFTNIINKMGN